LIGRIYDHWYIILVSVTREAAKHV